MPTADPQPVLAYATPEPRISYWPAFILCLTGLGLILLGGCFTIGVLLLSEKPGPWNSRELVLSSVLYFACSLCFVAAAIVLVIGIRRALR